MARASRSVKVPPAGEAPTSLRAQLQEFKRERILGEMIDLFKERGFRGATLDALAERLQVTKPFIYQFFDNKQHLLATLYERGARELVEAVDRALAEPGPASERLRRFVHRFALQNIQHRAISAVFNQEERDLPAETLTALRAIHGEFDAKLARLIQQGVDGGEFRVEQPHLAGLAISGMVRWIHRWFREGRLRDEEVAALFARYALNLVGYGAPDMAPGGPREPAPESGNQDR